MENTDIETALRYYNQELAKAIATNDEKLICVFEGAVRNLEHKKAELDLDKSKLKLEESDTNLLAYVLKTCQHCNKSIKEAKTEEEIKESIDKKNMFKKLFDRFIKVKKFYK